MFYHIRVVLQFTNEILIDSIKVKDLLEQETKKKFFILADRYNLVNMKINVISAKASCCIDIVGARHINPDLVVHFGDACLSDDIPSNIHIEYVFPKLKMNLEDLQTQVRNFKNQGNITKDLLVHENYLFFNIKGHCRCYLLLQE